MPALFNNDEGKYSAIACLVIPTYLRGANSGRLSPWQCPNQKTQVRTCQLEDIDLLGRSHFHQAVTYHPTSSHLKRRQRKLRKRVSGVVLAVQAALASEQRDNLLCNFAISRTSKGAKLLRCEPIFG